MDTMNSLKRYDAVCANIVKLGDEYPDDRGAFFGNRDENLCKCIADNYNQLKKLYDDLTADGYNDAAFSCLELYRSLEECREISRDAGFAMEIRKAVKAELQAGA